ncbi:hypothetical protein FO519_009920, partial [Halicephalobus sp. NKZ332]
MKLVLLAVFAVALSGTSAATVGWDGIQAVSESGFKCLAQHGYHYFVARVWESTGNYDNTGIQNIKNAKKAGWGEVDGYIFPCLKSSCAHPKNQVEAVVNKLHADGAKFSMLWLDIEKLAWPADHNHNRQFITDMMHQLDAMKVNYGIYTNNNMWAGIVGDWTGASHKPLWWAEYDGHQDFSKFKPFGGWKKPTIHQYSGSVNGPCGAVSESGFKCLAEHGYHFFIARVWESTGNYDNTGIQNIKNAKAAGWSGVDGYIFPCLKSSCAHPKNQVEAVVNELHAKGAKFG